MDIKIASIEVQRTERTKNSEPIYSATATVSTPIGPLQAIFLFTQSGLFLLKHGRPLVRFKDYNKSCDHKIHQGQTDYQALLYNRIIENLGELKTRIVSYLLTNDFIDAACLKAREPKLYVAAKQTDDLNFK